MLVPMRPDALVELGIDLARLDTIATGAIVLDTTLEMLGKPVAYVARSALREGALIDLARRDTKPPYPRDLSPRPWLQD